MLRLSSSTVGGMSWGYYKIDADNIQVYTIAVFVPWKFRLHLGTDSDLVNCSDDSIPQR